LLVMGGRSNRDSAFATSNSISLLVFERI
jgi:hypothetical protein